MVKRTMFTPGELAELAAFDAMVDAEPALGADLAASSRRDQEIGMGAPPKRSEKGRYAKLTDDQKARRREYERRYREANREAVREKRRERYQRTREHALAVGRAYRAQKKLEARA